MIAALLAIVFGGGVPATDTMLSFAQRESLPAGARASLDSGTVRARYVPIAAVIAFVIGFARTRSVSDTGRIST